MACGETEDMEEPKENEGRVPWTELSARDLSCSDQLKPWSGRGINVSEGFLWVGAVLACAGVLRRRPEEDRTAAMDNAGEAGLS